MKKMFLYGMVILVSIAFSSLFWLYGLYQGKLADAQESFSAFDFQDADRNYGDAEQYLNYGRNVPWLLDPEFIDIKNRRSEARYWLGHYDDLVSGVQVQPGSDNNSNPAEYFLQGNAFYRILETEKDKAKVLSLLDLAISKYVDAINGDTANLNATFNYEYLLMIRNGVPNGKPKLPLKQKSKGRSGEDKGDQPGQDSNIHGQEGAQSVSKDTDKILIRVPISGDESKEKGNDNVGKGVIKRKKG